MACKQKKPTGTKRRIVSIFAAALIVLGIAVVSLDQDNIQTENIELPFARLPKEFDGYKIVLISDLHAKRFGKNNETLISLVSEQKPDMIALTGDLCADPEEVPDAVKLCKSLAKIAPVYYVFGNHEWAFKVVRQLKDGLSGTGVTILQNEYLKLKSGGGSVCLLGLEDPNGPYDMKTITETVTDLREEQGDPFILALSHRNSRFDEYSQHRLDLVLSGHAHGGIIRLPVIDGIIGPGLDLFPKYTSGKYESNGTVMVVSRGLGNALINMHVFNRPHLPVITLKKAY